MEKPSIYVTAMVWSLEDSYALLRIFNGIAY